MDSEGAQYDPQPDHTQRMLVRARQISLDESRGHVFGPVDLDIDEGGVTVLAAPPSSARTALLLALCGRMHLTGGSLTVLGYTNDPHEVFRMSAVAGIDEVDGFEPAVTVQDAVTEQLQWLGPWYYNVPRARRADLKRLCGEVFGEIPLPSLDAFVQELPIVQRLLLKTALANGRRPPVLVVGPLDGLAGGVNQERVLSRLVALGERQSIVTADVNPVPADLGVRKVIHLTGLPAATVTVTGKGDTQA